jgi:hypothetical protein
MLSLTKKAVIIVLACLVTAVAASAQSKPKDEVLPAGERIKSSAAAASAQAQLGVEIAQKEMAKVKDELEKKLKLPMFGYSGQRGPAVLVVPSTKIDADYISRAAEDLAVMAKIIDKQLAQADMKKSYTFDFHGGETRGICIEGYGALFETRVDFPLVPSREKPQESGEAAQKDQLWEQTKREIESPAQPGLNLWISSPHSAHSGQSTIPEYDPDKVDWLKKVLTATLKYAANIRDLRPDEPVMIVVRTELPGVAFYGQTVAVSTKGGNTLIKGPVPMQEDSASKGVLIIRAKKSDAEAYSSGKIDQEEFSKRVSVLLY